jgi:hypothetical protein
MRPTLLPKCGLVLGLAIGALTCTKASAINRVWAKTGGVGSWSNQFNWSPNDSVPNPGDDVFCTSVNANSNTILVDQLGPPQIWQFHSVQINESGAGSMTVQQSAFTLNTQGLIIANGGNGTYDVQGGAAQVGSGTLNTFGTLNVGAAASFQATTFRHAGGVFNSNGTATLGNYTLQSGTINLNAGHFGGTNFTQSGGVFNTGVESINFSGTYTYNGGVYQGFGGGIGAQVNCGTFVDNAGTFSSSVDTTKLIVNGNGTFLVNLANRSSLTVPAGQSIWINNVFDQVGGTSNNSGFVGGSVGGVLGAPLSIFRIGGNGTWNQIGNGSTKGLDLYVGGPDLIGSSRTGIGQAGTFTMNSTGSLHLGSGLVIGVLGDGSMLQSSGLVQVGGVGIGSAVGLIRGAAPTYPPQRGYYGITGGTLTASGMVIAATDALGGTFNQSGGNVSLGYFTSNADSTSSGVINITGGLFAAAADTSTNNGSFTVSGGRAVLTSQNLNGSGSVTVNGTGSMSVGRLRQNSVVIGGSGLLAIERVSLGAPVAVVNRVKSLTFEQSGNNVLGTFNLGIDWLIDDYDPVIGSPKSSIRQFISSAYANGNWTGTGLGTSIAATDPQHHKALGYAESSDVFGAGGGQFGDMLVDNSSILIRPTLYGDANLDNKVDLTDFTLLASSFNTANKDWFHGDFNYDGSVGLTDFTLLASNFNQTYLSDTSSGVGAAVPEPVAFMGMLILAVSRRRR